MDCGAQEAVYFVSSYHRVAKVARRREGHLPKSLDLDENFKPYHLCHFVSILRFVAIYALF